MSTVDRRTVLASGLAFAGSSLLPGCVSHAGAQSSGSSTKPLSILILGGTGFTGPHQVRYALSRGHKLTLFNRGRRPKEWPAAVLKGNVNHFVFISTLSVYASDAKPGQDESAPRHTYAGRDALAETTADLRKNLSLYGPLKAASEDEAHKHFAGMTTVIRPGLIVGPGDETDRFTYWPVRLSRGGKVLVPPLADPVGFIDARNRAELIEASAAFLRENRVSAWGDLPVWVPGQGETAGFHRRSNARAMAAGLTFRPVPATAADTLAWWNAQDEKRRVLRAGLKAQREAQLLAKLKA